MKAKEKDFDQIFNILLEELFTQYPNTLNEIDRRISFGRELYDWIKKDFEKTQKQQDENKTQEPV